MYKLALTLLLLISGFIAIAQTMADKPAATVEDKKAKRIAKLVSDSLSLNEGQRQQLYEANIKFQQMNLNKRQQFANSDSLDYYMRGAESKRDSLYRLVLPQSKYQLYLQKKKVFLSNN